MLGTTQDHLEISLHAIMASINPKIMRVKARVRNCLLIVLIDSRSTHKFLDFGLFQKTNMTCNDKETVKVKVASGAIVVSEVKVAKVSFSIQGRDFETEGHVINLASSNMVLGVSLLQTLGNIH